MMWALAVALCASPGGARDLYVDVGSVTVQPKCSALQNGTQLLCADDSSVSYYAFVSASSFPVISYAADFQGATYDIAALNLNFALIGNAGTLHSFNWDTKAIATVESGLTFTRRFERLSSELIAVFATDRLVIAREHPHQPGVYVRALQRAGQHTGVALAGNTLIFFSGTLGQALRWQFAVSPVDGQIVLMQEQPLDFTTSHRYSLGGQMILDRIAMKTNVSTVMGGTTARSVTWMWTHPRAARPRAAKTAGHRCSPTRRCGRCGPIFCRASPPRR